MYQQNGSVKIQIKTSRLKSIASNQFFSNAIRIKQKVRKTFQKRNFITNNNRQPIFILQIDEKICHVRGKYT